MQFTVSLAALPVFAQQFWNLVGPATCFLFHGQMGAGKTTIIEALCAAKGSTDAMGSPTFSIINEYHYTEGGQQKIIYHIDLYRLRDEEEIVQAGVEDCIYSGALSFIEWPEKSPELYDEEAVAVWVDVVDANHRLVKIKLPLPVVSEQS